MPDQKSMTWGDPPEREDAVGTFARLVDACRRRDVRQTIELKRALRELGFRVEPIAAREGGGR